MVVAKKRNDPLLWGITPINSSRMHKIGHMLQDEGSPTTVLDSDDVPKTHRRDGYNTAQVLKNIRMQSISIYTERMDVSNAKISTSLSDMVTTAGVEGSAPPRRQ